MSVPRTDVRFYLDAEYHSLLKRLCAVDDIELAAFVERELIAILDREFHRAASLLNAVPEHHGNARESTGSLGQGRDLPFASRAPR